MDQLHTLLEHWWADFRQGNPSASTAYALLTAKEGTIFHDHIALRTFNDETVNIDTLMAPLEAAGYTYRAEYAFPKTHVYARHYAHDMLDLPKVFISQLEVGSFSGELQHHIGELLSQIPPQSPAQWDIFMNPRPWNLSFAVYQALREESEYAAWVSAFGFRPTHFAVRTEAFAHYADLTTLNSLLKQGGLELNTGGGEIQGSPEIYLEQSSLKASTIVNQFSDGSYPIPGTYYEFAKRYSVPDGTVFDGFNLESAGNLFKSTQ